MTMLSFSLALLELSNIDQPPDVVVTSLCVCVFFSVTALNCSSHCRSVPTPAYQWPASPILPPISSRTPHLVPETLVPNTNSSSSSLAGGDFGHPKPHVGASWIALQESPGDGGGGGTTAISSNNDWRMVRMYELMEDFEEVLSRAPISVSQEPMLSMGGRTDGTSSSIAVANGRREDQEDEEDEEDAARRCSKGSQRRSGDQDPAIFTAGNCLSSGCCYTSSSTESDTVRPDPTVKSTSKYKKQRERLLSRPTL